MSHKEEEHTGTERGYYTYHTAPKEKKKSTGLFVVLTVLALVTGLVSWAINAMDLKVNFGKNNMTVSVGEQEKPQQLPELVAYTDTSVSGENTGGLVIEQTPYSVGNYPVDGEETLSLQQIYEKVVPGVVSVCCVSRGSTVEGTGIVMSRDGHIITNARVVEQAKQIYVITADEAQHEATLIGCDDATDLAVLKVEAENLQPVEFGDSGMLRVGDVVVAIGNPFGTQLGGTMTDGIVSAINHDLNLSGRQMTVIQTNAVLDVGHGGGPLVNCYGQVVGIGTMNVGGAEHVEGLGFAIPVVQAKPILDELVTQGYVSGRPSIGILGQTVELEVQIFYQLPPGVIVTGLEGESNAEKAGLQFNDVIVEYNGQPILSLDDLVSAKQNSRTGDTVVLTVFRGGQSHTISLELTSQVKANIY